MNITDIFAGGGGVGFKGKGERNSKTRVGDIMRSRNKLVQISQ